MVAMGAIPDPKSTRFRVGELTAFGYKRLLVVDKSHDSIVLINGEIGAYDSPLSVMGGSIPMLSSIHAGKDWTCSGADLPRDDRLESEPH